MHCSRPCVQFLGAPYQLDLPSNASPHSDDDDGQKKSTNGAPPAPHLLFYLASGRKSTNIYLRLSSSNVGHQDFQSGRNLPLAVAQHESPFFSGEILH